MYILCVYICMIYMNVYMHGGGICLCIHIYVYIHTYVCVGWADSGRSCVCPDCVTVR